MHRILVVHTIFFSFFASLYSSQEVKFLSEVSDQHYAFFQLPPSYKVDQVQAGYTIKNQENQAIDLHSSALFNSLTESTQHIVFNSHDNKRYTCSKETLLNLKTDDTRPLLLNLIQEVTPCEAFDHCNNIVKLILNGITIKREAGNIITVNTTNGIITHSLQSKQPSIIGTMRVEVLTKILKENNSQSFFIQIGSLSAQNGQPLQLTSKYPQPESFEVATITKFLIKSILFCGKHYKALLFSSGFLIFIFCRYIR